MQDGFVSGKAAVAGHNCFIVKAANAAWRKSIRKDCLISIPYITIRYVWVTNRLWEQWKKPGNPRILWLPPLKRRDEKGVKAVMCQRWRCPPPGAPWPEGPLRFGPPLRLPPEGPCSGMCRDIWFRSGSGRRIVRRGARGVGSRRGRKFR